MRFLGYLSTILLAILICWFVFGDLRCGGTRAGGTVILACRSSLLEVPHG